MSVGVAGLKRFGLFAEIGEDSFFPTIGAAVSSYLEAHAVEWTDEAGVSDKTRSFSNGCSKCTRRAEAPTVVLEYWPRFACRASVLENVA